MLMVSARFKRAVVILRLENYSFKAWQALNGGFCWDYVDDITSQWRLVSRVVKYVVRFVITDILPRETLKQIAVNSGQCNVLVPSIRLIPRESQRWPWFSRCRFLGVFRVSRSPCAAPVSPGISRSERY
ncbi:hypothetical protein GWI33_013782 [Rhynchophorus ferrugineus]|uniref:Uncharacterized protein n=1 Tax=Rhynchophorus ferrugineus TaxID=354439 RepID=A0A834I5U6_RHYFE|nr:hypothetical protein GWI33_013782 [Rhynchophorus ferrugineus]